MLTPLPQTIADYLKIFDALPDLLELAHEQSPGNLYPCQDELREQYRAEGVAFRWSMPLRLRCFKFCRQCDRKIGQIIYELEDPRHGTKVGTGLIHVHAVREHGAEINANVKKFLAHLS